MNNKQICNANGQEYLRLSATCNDIRYSMQPGIFYALSSLLRSNETTYRDEAKLWQYRYWFNRHLAAPRNLQNVRAIFWFKDSTANEVELWTKILELKGVLDQYYYQMQIIRTQRPGYIVYEDKYQIAAIPFRDTFVPPFMNFTQDWESKEAAQ